MRNGLIASVVLILIGVGLLSYALTQGSSNDPVKVGLVVELTGDIPAVGLSSQQGAELAAKEINDAGGLQIGNKKQKIELVTKDNTGNTDETTKVTEQLIKDERVVAVIGPNASRYAIPAAAVVEREKTVLISPWSTNPKTTLNDDNTPKQYVIRAAYTDPFQGQVLAKYVRNDLKQSRAAILTDSSADVLVGQAKYFKDTFTANGGTIVADENFKTGVKNVASQLHRIRSANPEIIFLPAYYADAAAAIKQAHSLGIRTAFLGSDAWGNTEIVEACGQDCNGYFLTAHYAADSTNPATKGFVDAYKAAYNNVTPDDVAALTYDSVKLLAKVIEMAGTSERQSIRTGLAGIKDFTGVTGKMTFSGQPGDPVKGAVILQIKDGKTVWHADAQP